MVVGDIAFRFIDFVHNTKSRSDAISGSHVTVCDINQAMLDVGKRRAALRGHGLSALSIVVDAQCRLENMNRLQCSVFLLQMPLTALQQPEYTNIEFSRILEVHFCLNFHHWCRGSVVSNYSKWESLAVKIVITNSRFSKWSELFRSCFHNCRVQGVLPKCCQKLEVISEFFFNRRN